MDGYNIPSANLYIPNHLSLDDVQITYEEHEYHRPNNIKALVGDDGFEKILDRVKLLPRQQKIMRYLFLDGYTQAQTALIMDSSQSAICQSKQNIIRKFKKHFQNE